MKKIIAALMLFVAVPLVARQRAVRTPTFYIVDLMELYTASAVRDNGGVDKIEAKIRHAVDMLNSDVRNSGVDNVQFNLVFVGPIEVDSEDGFEVLRSLPRHERVAELRDRHRADLVGVWMTSGSYALGPSMTSSYPGAGFHVIASNQHFDSHLLSHEVGHNFGMKHDNDPIDGDPYPWARGICHSDAPQFRDIMAVSCTYRLVRVFSNPQILIDGVPAGIPDRADNVRMLRMTLPMIASYR